MFSRYNGNHGHQLDSDDSDHRTIMSGGKVKRSKIGSKQRKGFITESIIRASRAEDEFSCEMMPT